MRNFALVVVCFACAVLAQNTVVNPSQAQLDVNDNNVLRFALTLENLEASFYRQFQTRFTPTDFANAGYDASVYANFALISTQETAHVTLLNSVLQLRGGAIIQECTYNFTTINSVATYVGAARLFENVGTTAYDGAIGLIYNRTLQQAAATVATVEARHSAYLNRLPGVYPIGNSSYPQNNPFPQDRDTANTPTTVAGLVLPFIVPGSCSYDVNSILPQTLVVVPVAAPAGSPTNPPTYEVLANDLRALNYALTLEILEASFYNQFLNNAANNQAAFVAAGYTPLDYSYFQLIQAHENAHVVFLQTAIVSLGGSPIPNCTYNFASAFVNVSTFVGTAQLLENTGVSAYDGAVNRITSPDLRQAAATVATVEARHAAYLNQLRGVSPFPDTTDTATDPNTIIQTVSTNFIVSCPVTPVAPNPIFVYPYSNGTNAPSTSSSSSTASKATSTTSTTKGSSTSTTSSAASIAASLLVVAAVAILAL